MVTGPPDTYPIIAWLNERPRWQRQVAVALLGCYVLAQAVRWSARTQLDRWWFEQVTDSSIWGQRLGAQVILVAVSGVVSAVMMLGSNRIALRTEAPAGQSTFRPIAAVASRLGPATGWLAVLVPLWLTLLIAKAANAYWMQWLMFRHATDVGTDAPAVGFDLGYHLFRLPLMSTTTAWLMSLIATSLLMAVVIYVLHGCLRLPIAGRRSSPVALRHLAGLAALWLAVRAADYWFVKYPGLASSPDGRFRGAGFARMHGPGIAYRPLAITAALAAILLGLYAAGKLAPRHGIAAAAITAGVHVLLVVAAPPLVQRLIVDPAEADREAEYIGYNLDATRAAFDLDGIDIESVDLSDGVAVADARARTPLFETAPLAAPLQVLQGTRGTRVNDVDLDRYLIDATLRPVYVATRNAAKAELPERGWVQEHMVYTHGDGLVATAADATAAGGLLEFNDLETSLGLDQTALYYGPDLDGWYVFTNTRRTEQGGSAYAGATGIDLGSTGRRVVAAVALGDYNVAVSSEFTGDSRLLYNRSLRERVQSIAPFVQIDGDPFPVISDGHVVWVVEGYTTSSTYPYAQTAIRTGMNPASGVGGEGANFVRRAVIATVDAYDGTVHLYRADRSGSAAADPVLELWDRLLPGLIEPFDSLPASLASHLRYGPDAFAIQTNMLAQYHVDDPETLFNGTDSWTIAPSPTPSPDGATGPGIAVTTFDGDGEDGRWTAYRSYIPGAADVPSSRRDELAALAVGDHLDGTLRIVRVASADGRQLTSPHVAQSLILADPEVTQLITLLNANDSHVTFGPMTPVVTDDGLAWLRPMIVTGTAATATPRVYAMLAVSNGEVGIGDDTTEALADTVP